MKKQIEHCLDVGAIQDTLQLQDPVTAEIQTGPMPQPPHLKNPLATAHTKHSNRYSGSQPYRTTSSRTFGRIEIVIVPTAQPSKNVAITLDAKLIQTILCKRFRKVAITTIKNRNDLEELAKRQPDLVFSGVKYFQFHDQDVRLNDFLDHHQIPYLGSPKSALDCEYDKTVAKELVQRAGLSTAPYIRVHPGETLSQLPTDMQFPVFIKPANCGDSIGIDSASLAFTHLEMQRKIQQLFDSLRCDVLIEQYLPGNEYSVGIIENNSTKRLTAMPIEIRAEKNTEGHRILDFQTKKNDAEEVLSVTDQKIHRALSDLGQSVFRVLGGTSFGRIDVRMCASGIPHFMEANLMPGLKKGYFFRSCALNLGMSYEQMIIGLAENRIKLKTSHSGVRNRQQIGTIIKNPILQPT